MNKTVFKNTFFIIVGEVLLSIIITIFTNKFFYEDRTFFYNYIDFIFFLNLPLFIVGSMMILGESGFFNVFVYTTNKVRSVVSEKYRYTLKESDDVGESEIEEYLKDKYLYNKSSFTWTFPLFYGSLLILLSIFLSVALFYGI